MGARAATQRQRPMRIGTIGLVVALMAALLVVESGLDSAADAQTPRCFGRAATIIARPGQVTVGTSGADVIVGTSGADVIRGRGGNDRICGLGGGDTIDAGGGNDRVDGGSGNDRINGGTGRDRLEGGRGQDRIRGGRGADDLRGGRGNDDLHGRGGFDTCAGGRGRDEVQSCDEVSLTESFFLPSACLFGPAVWTGGVHPDNGSASLGFAEGGVSEAIAIDLDGDGRPGRARVIWCTFGGNAVSRTVHLWNDGGSYLGSPSVEEFARTRTQVSPSIVGADGNQLAITALGYDVGDPTCCPSLTTDLRYRWNGQQIEVIEFDGARGLNGSPNDLRDRFISRWNNRNRSGLESIASPAAIEAVRDIRPNFARVRTGNGIDNCTTSQCWLWPEEPGQFFVIFLTVRQLDTGRYVITDATWEGTN